MTGREMRSIGNCARDQSLAMLTNTIYYVIENETHWSLSDSKSPQVFRALFSILAVLNNAVVWMVSARPLISKSSSPFNNPLIIVPRAPITIGVNVTYMFHSFFFQFPSNVQVFILLFAFFQFYSVVSQNIKVHNFSSSLFCC